MIDYEGRSRYKISNWIIPFGNQHFIMTTQDVDRYIAVNNMKPVDLRVEDLNHISLHGTRFLNTEKKHRVEKAELEFPIYVLKVDDKYVRILDGNHRHRKAKDLGLEYIKAIVFDMDYKEMIVKLGIPFNQIEKEKEEPKLNKKDRMKLERLKKPEE